MVENIDKSLETDDLEVGVLPLTSSILLGEGPKDNLSIPVYFIKHTVGNWEPCWEYILKEKRNGLFPKSLMSATIQDGSTRERRDDLIAATSCCSSKLLHKIIYCFVFLLYFL